LDLAEIVAAISNNYGWEDWNKIGLAIFAASKDRGDGFFGKLAKLAYEAGWRPQTVAAR
jgi:hypothetical protein